MKTLLLIAAASLAACSTMQPPRELETLHSAAKNRIEYQNYAKKYWRYVAPDEKASGNCAVHAMTVLIDANKAGYDPRLILCRLSDGTGHAFTRINGWDSDVRFKHLIPSSQQDCR